MGAGSMVEIFGTGYKSADSVQIYPDKEISWMGKNDLEAIGIPKSPDDFDTEDPEVIIFNMKQVQETFKITGTTVTGSPAAYDEVKDTLDLLRSGKMLWLTWDNLDGTMSDLQDSEGGYIAKAGSALVAPTSWHYSKNGEYEFAWDYTIDFIMGKEM